MLPTFTLAFGTRSQWERRNSKSAAKRNSWAKPAPERHRPGHTVSDSCEHLHTVKGLTIRSHTTTFEVTLIHVICICNILKTIHPSPNSIQCLLSLIWLTHSSQLSLSLKLYVSSCGVLWTHSWINVIYSLCYRHFLYGTIHSNIEGNNRLMAYLTFNSIHLFKIPLRATNIIRSCFVRF